MANIKIFTELKVWIRAHELVLEVYQVTKNFPLDEKYALTQQLRRAAVSVASNIVEGFNRLSVKESLHFYSIARGSLEETKYQLLIARDLKYLSCEVYEKIINLGNEVGKMLNAWVQCQIKNSKT